MPGSSQRLSPSASGGNTATAAATSEPGTSSSRSNSRSEQGQPSSATTSTAPSHADARYHTHADSAPSSTRLPALSHARSSVPAAMPSPTSANSANQQQQSSQISRQLPPPQQQQHYTGPPVQGSYPGANGSMMQSRLTYPQGYGHPQPAYGAPASAPAVPPSGQAFGYSHLHSPVQGYGQHPGVMQPQAYTYPGYPITYAPAQPLARVATHSPTTVQSPVSATSRYGVHPPASEAGAGQYAGAAGTQKRKRKSIGGDKSVAGLDSNDEDGSGSDGAQPMGGSSMSVDRMSKRTKTQRACDPCRRKKIRCDVLPDAEPPICQHCKQYGFECTFFLPITETRFKKKREQEEAAKQRDTTEGGARGEGDERPPESGDPQSTGTGPSESPSLKDGRGQGDVKIYGPTSLQYLVHTTNHLPHNIFENYDNRWNMTWAVGPRGDGFIHVHDPEPAASAAAEGEEVPKQMAVPKAIDRHVLETLINSYFTEVQPYFPVITQEEFMAHSSDSFLLYSVCIAGACMRNVSQDTFEAVRAMLTHVMRSADTLSSSTITNVQGLLIMHMCFDVHQTSHSSPSTANYLRTGTAIRMAQDLGLHRAEAVKEDLPRRRRVWACCLIADHTIAAAMGHPFIIDKHDCDVCLPPEEPYKPGSPTPRPLAYLGYLVKLIMLLGEVVKLIYGPMGISLATDVQLNDLLGKLDAWKANLPSDLQFHVSTTSTFAGILHMMHTCVMIMFWRVFMRITYSCPVHIKFSLSVERWSNLVKDTKDTIQWFAANNSVWDIWWLPSYCLTYGCLCLYQTWTRRKDAEALEHIQVLRETVRAWEDTFAPDHMKSRRKTAELISLLHEATKSAPPKREKAILNPTAGVSTRFDTTPMIFRRDETRPGGGVYILQEAKDLQDYKDLPAGTFMVQNKKHAASDSSASSPTTRNAPNTIAVALPDASRGDYSQYPATYGSGLQQQQDTPMSDAEAGNPNGEGVGMGMGMGMGNLNPSLAMPGADVQQVQLLNPLDQLQHLNQLDDGTVTVDAGWFADGLPGNLLEWDAWSTYFNNRYPSQPAAQPQLGPMSSFPYMPDPNAAPQGGDSMEGVQGPSSQG